MVLAALNWLILLGDPATAVASRLAIIRAAPEFELTAHTGQRVKRSDLAGKVVLVSFIFTTCNGSCPATTHRMGQILDELKKHPWASTDEVRLVSITLDPERDTPEVLRNYLRLYDADERYWTFATGPPADVRKMIADWGMWARPAANGQLDHPSRIFLLDKRGRIREIYNLNFLKPAWVVEDIEQLVREK